MSESLFEITFKKHAKLTLEAVSSAKKEMNGEKNAALKSLYIMLRDCLVDITDEAKKEKINSKNCDSKFPKFLENYVPKNPYITVKNKETLNLQLPKSAKDCFPDLEDNFFLKIVSKDKPILKSGKGAIAKAGLAREDKDYSIKGMYLRIDFLIEDFNEIKAHIQHELQHINLRGEVDGLKDGYDKFHGYIEYLGDPSEIQAYAKEYAYRYHKKYPRDTELNFEKLKKLFSDKKYESFNNYVLFGEEADVIRSKHDVSNADIKRMKKIHRDYIDTLKKSLNYFL